MAVEDIPSELFEKWVVSVDLIMIKYRDHGPFTCLVTIIQSVEYLRFDHSVLAVNSMVTLVMEYYVCSSLHIPNLRCHQTKPFVLILGVQCDLILLYHHFPICFPKLNGSTGGQFWQLVYRWQVDW